MTAHWAFVVPIAVAYALRHARARSLFALRSLIVALTAWLYIYNVYLIIDYMLC